MLIIFLIHFSFSPSKFSVTNFLASMRAGVFKFCIHIESGQVYCGTENKTQIYFALFLLFLISHSNVIDREICDKYFSGTVARKKLLFGTGVVNYLLFYVKENQISPTYSSLNFFIFLSRIFRYKKIHLSFLRDWEAHKVETWSTYGQ